MAKRGPKKKASEPVLGVAGLKSQNIMIGSHRTSMRLEPSMWDALEDIARRERLSVHDLCGLIKERLTRQQEIKGATASDSEVTLTSAVRVFIAAYYRRACTDEGHQRAGHGLGDPFSGTPFELATLSKDEPPPEDGGEVSSSPSSGLPDPSPSGCKTTSYRSGVAIEL